MVHIKSIVLIAMVCCFAATAYSQLAGGLKAEKPADEIIEGIMTKAMDKIQASYPGGFKAMKAVSYRTQVVSGMNYFVKVKVIDDSGRTKHAHLRLYLPFKSDIELHGIKTDVNEHSPLVYFQAR